MLMAIPIWGVPIALLIAVVPRALAGPLFLLILPVLVALAAANVRRLHDVGLHAHRVFFWRAGGVALVVVPLLIVAFVEVAEPVSIALLALSGATILASLMRLVWIQPEWMPGDPGPNEFGPPPIR